MTLLLPFTLNPAVGTTENTEHTEWDRAGARFSSTRRVSPRSACDPHEWLLFPCLRCLPWFLNCRFKVHWFFASLASFAVKTLFLETDSCLHREFPKGITANAFREIESRVPELAGKFQPRKTRKTRKRRPDAVPAVPFSIE